MKQKIFHKQSKREFLHGRLLGCFIIIYLFLFFSNSLFAQWTKITQFPKRIYTIFFKEFVPTPKDGFVALNPVGPPPQELWHTMDGGKTWQQVPLFPTSLGYPPTPFCFTFKTSLIGWFCDWDFQLFKTLDGGTTWSLMPFSNAWQIYYVPYTDKLIITGPGNIIGSLSYAIGIAFSDSIHGIISAEQTLPGKMNYTSDGGITWQESTVLPEQHLPIGIKGTLMFYAISERTSAINKGEAGTVVRSNDGGRTWKKTYQYHEHIDDESVTGTLQYNSAGIYFQTVPDNSEGIMMSSDSGYTFNSICGPTNTEDTRFYVRDSFMYAGDKYGGLWLNTTGIGSNSTPQLLLNKVLTVPLLGCKRFDTLLTFTFFDSCNNIQAKLVSAQVIGSNNFSFSSASAIPRTIHPDDSLTISYNPVSSKPDTAALHLKFHLGWKDFDTTIQLFGSGRIPKESIRFLPSSPLYSAIAGNMVDLEYLPDKNISARGLDSISFDLTFNGDILDYRSVSTSIPGASISLAALSPAPLPEYRARVTIRGKDMVLDSLVPVADIKFQAMVAKEMKTPITMTNVLLNGGDADYKNCVLSADTANTSFDLIALCGDSTLSKYLKGLLPLKIISIHPNPAQDEIIVEISGTDFFSGTDSQSVTGDGANGLRVRSTGVLVFDALGAKVYSEIRNLPSGQSSIHLPIHDLAPGVYFVRVGDVGRSFVKMK
jgi:hypothetical protein